MVMKNLQKLISAGIAMLVLTGPAWASPKTVTLNVSGMTCPACPLTVKKALEKVSGVSKIDVRYEKKQVVVTFDDAKTNTEALVKATTNAGYPSQPEKTAK
jgi:periplasmic mercuric ion binding protein